MSDLDRICEQIRMDFDRKTARRDAALAQARQLTRHASLAIRAIHREEKIGRASCRERVCYVV